MQKHCGNIQEDHLDQNGWELEGIRKKLPKEEIVETRLKGSVRINQMEQCADKQKLYCKDKYIHDRVLRLENLCGYCSGVS